MSTPVQLLGLLVAPGAGKDSAAWVLQCLGWSSIAFANALRIEAAYAWGVDTRLFADRLGKSAACEALRIDRCHHVGFVRWAAAHDLMLDAARSPRWAMQAWGTWRRSGDKAYWVSIVANWIGLQRAMGNTHLVISDVRLPNEAQMLRDHGGRLVRVHRPGRPALPADEAAHESERHDAILVDAEIHNDGDLYHLADEVGRVMAALPDIPFNRSRGFTHG